LTLAGFDGLFADCTGRSLIGTFDVSRNTYTGSHCLAQHCLWRLSITISAGGRVGPFGEAVLYLTLGILPEILILTQ
jgi:hypothetical protein